MSQLGDSFNQAIEYGQDLVADSKRVLGEMNPCTQVAREQLAVAYQAAGQPDEAERLRNRPEQDHD